TPKDVPGDVLAQLGNRVQHALRAFTPDDAKALKATASTFPTSEHDLVEVIPALGTGEAIVTVMSEDGTPTPVAITAVRAPESSMQPAGAEVISAAVAASPLQEEYGTAVDRESAFEILAARAEKDAREVEEREEEATADGPARRSRSAEEAGGLFEKPAERPVLRSAGTALGRAITRSLFGTRRRRCPVGRSTAKPRPHPRVEAPFAREGQLTSCPGWRRPRRRPSRRPGRGSGR